jgi:two-component system NtrC family response regulator
VADGRFREDLYYRLAEMVVRIPALAERTGDAALLARHFVARFARTLGSDVTGFTPDALAAIDAWHWPGNVRELENRVKRAVIMAEGRLAGTSDLDLQPASDDSLPINLRAVREAADRQAIRRALMQSDGNISGTARLLGVSRPTLYDLMKSYDLHA